MSRYTKTIITIIMFGVVFATSSLLVTLWLFPPLEEPSPVIAVLNENRQGTNYPTNVTQYSNVTYHVEVWNHMGAVQYFYILVKFATIDTLSSPSIPSTAQIILQRERILSNGGYWTFPVHLNMTTTGLNFRITFEVWRYDINSDSIVYTGVWAHLPLNVTAS